MAIAKIVVTRGDGSTDEFDGNGAAPLKLRDGDIVSFEVATLPPVAINNNRFFPQEIILGAQASHKKYWPRGPYVSVTLAQWALESGYGKHQSGLNNYFGIQANKTQLEAGQYTVRWSREEDESGASEPKDEAFANYASIADGFDAHAQLLTSPHYELCVHAQSPEAYCAALKECGYATAHNYVAELLSIIKVHNLGQYDQRF